MKLQEFKELLDKFIEEECSLQPDGRILMQSHNVDVYIDFIGQDGEELPPVRTVHERWVGCGCTCGLTLNFSTNPDKEIY